MNVKRKDSEANQGVPSKLRQTLTIRMVMQGWSNINQFKKGTGVPYSLETVRRAFNECPYKNLDTITLAIIMKHLNYSPKEIKTILGKHLAANDPVLELISDRAENKLTIGEERLIEAYRTIMDKNPELSNSLADHLDLLGKIANVPTRQATDALRR